MCAAAIFIGYDGRLGVGDDDTEKKPEGFEEQFREILRRANLTFMAQPEHEREAEPAGMPAEPGPDKRQERLDAIAGFRLKPTEVRDYLDRFVIRQDDAKKVLAVAICDHYNHVRRCIENPAVQSAEYAKHNILLLGPTGVGKTYLIRCISQLIGVPFAKADATKFSETGYVGHDVEDLVRDLVKAADGDTELAQYGIIFLDEIDKIAAQAAGGKDVSGRGVQINLLKLMEDTEVSLFSQTDIIGQMQAVMDMQKGKPQGKQTINTQHMLFIGSGSFDGLGEQVQRRIQENPIGFTRPDGGDREMSDYLRCARTQDFVDYGFEPEFIGRLPVRVVCDPLSAGDLEQIMHKSEGSILSQYEADFEGYGIRFAMREAASTAVAEKAHEEKTGARGLVTVLERVFRDAKFHLPATPIRQFTVDEAMVLDPGSGLERVLADKDVVVRAAMEKQLADFVERFKEEPGVTLRFTRQAADRVVTICLESGRTIQDYGSDLFKDLEHGLMLIVRNTGRRTFHVTDKFLKNPAEELSQRIAKSVKRGA